ncbi:hypothetical protein PGT21_013552 [Puccinia graminis f. sp. tritici]|uniref:Uncharacterized protein n=1 Tax=Puccinia graminis f. sp. tritici TaxID=56615 RepID=A0A5B0M6I0_PUCGR|nr:hypothetical protein PGT21_013552 [Puccinia graminis f. sp. tritici]
MKLDPQRCTIMLAVGTVVPSNRSDRTNILVCAGAGCSVSFRESLHPLKLPEFVLGMLEQEIKTLVHFSILLDLLHGTTGTTAINVNLPASMKSRGIEDESLRLRLDNKGESISVSHPLSQVTLKVDSSNVGQTKNQIEKLNDRLKAVEITAEGGETE